MASRRDEKNQRRKRRQETARQVNAGLIGYADKIADSYVKALNGMPLSQRLKFAWRMARGKARNTLVSKPPTAPQPMPTRKKGSVATAIKPEPPKVPESSEPA